MDLTKKVILHTYTKDYANIHGCEYAPHITCVRMWCLHASVIQDMNWFKLFCKKWEQMLNEKLRVDNSDYAYVCYERT